jgi:predicted glycosyltransferase
MSAELRLRIALYSHDTMGLGHMRRNVLIAHAVAREPLRAVVLMIAGGRRASAFSLPPETDVLTLPALYKEKNSRYRPRRLSIDLQELIAVRSAAIRAAVVSFDPDLFIVDNVPRGAVRELDSTLEDIRDRGRTRCVLGLRDVLDEPAAVRRDWERADNVHAIRTFYDAVWVYSDPRVYDLVREYRFPADIEGKIRYTGYLDQSARFQFSGQRGANPLGRLRLPEGRLAVCAVGGGQDGVELARAFTDAVLPTDYNGVIVTGPFMDEELQKELRERAAARSPRLRVIDFVSEPMHLLQKADRVISMGGYNTTYEALSLGKRMLIVPRVQPRTEQWIRATNLQRLGLVDVLHPSAVSPGALSAWLSSNGAPPPNARDRIDLGGLERIPAFAADLLGAPLPSSNDPLREGASVAR